MTRARTSRLLAVAVAGCIVFAACGDDDGGDADAATATTRPRTTTESSPATTRPEQAVLIAYRAFWDGYLEAADPMNPEHPVLEQIATGDELRQLRTAFLARLSASEVIRGDLELTPEVIAMGETEATVRDCYLDRTGVYDAASGQRKDAESGVRHLVTVRLVKEAAAWKVTSITREGDGCTPRAGE